MALYEIPLRANLAYLNFECDLDGLVVTLQMEWNVEGNHYFVCVYHEGIDIISGIGLHPEMDLLKHTKLGLGRLYIYGEDPTPENLGIRNRLLYESLQ